MIFAITLKYLKEKSNNKAAEAILFSNCDLVILYLCGFKVPLYMCGFENVCYSNPHLWNGDGNNTPYLRLILGIKFINVKYWKTIGKNI